MDKNVLQAFMAFMRRVLNHRTTYVPRLKAEGLGKYRNEKCPCNSGKKFKNCCLTKRTDYA
jgi:uncharacterized protein YecA (UPF0149 family)